MFYLFSTADAGVQESCPALKEGLAPERPSPCDFFAILPLRHRQAVVVYTGLLCRKTVNISKTVYFFIQPVSISAHSAKDWPNE